MLYIVTGANGAGKTANGLKWVRERQVKENRPVCYNGRFDMVEDGELKNWKKIEFKDWQAEPDGTIFFIDEAHNDLPVRPAGAAVPDHVKMLAEHRKRGFDFYFVSQHPQNLDSFVRRLVGSPGWHRHLKRVFGSTLVSVLQWDFVNPNCEKAGASKQAQVTTTPIPKEVYGWYRSASLHTGKVSIPKQVWYFVAAVAVAAFFIFRFLTGMGGQIDASKDKQDKAKPATQAVASDGGGSQRQGPISVDEYLSLRKPRIPDFPHTAGAYDQVTQPVVAPYPAACIHMGPDCRCYSQQATLLQVSGAVCLQIVKQGFFVDWAQAQQQPGQRQDAPSQVVAVAPVSAPMAVPAPVRTVQAPPQPGSTWSQGLAARNAEVRSALQQ